MLDSQLQSISYEELKATGLPLSTYIYYTLNIDYIIRYLHELEDNNLFDLALVIKRVVSLKNPMWITRIAMEEIKGVNVNDLARGLLACPDTEEKLECLYKFAGAIPSSYMYAAKEEIKRLETLKLISLNQEETSSYAKLLHQFSK